MLGLQILNLYLKKNKFNLQYFLMVSLMVKCNISNYSSYNLIRIISRINIF